MTLKEYEKASRNYKDYEHCKITCSKMNELQIDKIVFMDARDEKYDVNVCHKSKSKKTYFASDEELINLLIKTTKEFYENKYKVAEKNLKCELEGVVLK